jgi:hypothetical protein
MAEIDGRVRAHLANEIAPDVVGGVDGLDVDAPLSLD